MLPLGCELLDLLQGMEVCLKIGGVQKGLHIYRCRESERERGMHPIEMGSAQSKCITNIINSKICQYVVMNNGEHMVFHTPRH